MKEPFATRARSKIRRLQNSPMRYIPAVLLALPGLVSCAAPDDNTVTGRVLTVQGSDLSIEVDGEEKHMRLAGVIPPEPGACMYDKFAEMARYNASEYQDVGVRTVETSPDGVPLVTVEIKTYDDS